MIGGVVHSPICFSSTRVAVYLHVGTYMGDWIGLSLLGYYNCFKLERIL